VPGIFYILILLANWVANSSDKLNLTVALINGSTGFSATYPDAFILSSTKLEYFLSSSKKLLFLLMYSSNYLFAFYLRDSTDSTSSILSFYASLNLVKTPLRAYLGRFLAFTALIKSGRSKLLSFFTRLSNIYLIE